MSQVRNLWFECKGLLDGLVGWGGDGGFWGVYQAAYRFSPRSKLVDIRTAVKYLSSSIFPTVLL